MLFSEYLSLLFTYISNLRRFGDVTSMAFWLSSLSSRGALRLRGERRGMLVYGDSEASTYGKQNQ